MFLKSLVILKKMSLFKILVKPPISQDLNCLLLFLFARSRKTHSKMKFYKKVFLGNFGVKVMFLDFQSQKRSSKSNLWRISVVAVFIEGQSH